MESQIHDLRSSELNYIINRNDFPPFSFYNLLTIGPAQKLNKSLMRSPPQLSFSKEKGSLPFFPNPAGENEKGHLENMI